MLQGRTKQKQSDVVGCYRGENKGKTEFMRLKRATLEQAVFQRGRAISRGSMGVFGYESCFEFMKADY